MDWVFYFCVNGPSFVDGITNNVHDSAQCLRTNWNTDGSTSVNDLLSSDKTFSGVHGDGSDPGVTKMLGNFQDQSVLDALNFERVENWRDFAFELNIDDGADDLGDLSLFECVDR